MHRTDDSACIYTYYEECINLGWMQEGRAGAPDAHQLLDGTSLQLPMRPFLVISNLLLVLNVSEIMTGHNTFIYFINIRWQTKYHIALHAAIPSLFLRDSMVEAQGLFIIKTTPKKLNTRLTYEISFKFNRFITVYQSTRSINKPPLLNNYIHSTEYNKTIKK